MIFSIQILLYIVLILMKKDRRRNRGIDQYPLSLLTQLIENPVVARDALFIAITSSGVSRKERLFARAMVSGMSRQLIARLLFETKEHVRAPLDFRHHASMIWSRISFGIFVIDLPFLRIKQNRLKSVLSNPREGIVMKFMTNDIRQQDMCLSLCMPCTERYRTLDDLFNTMLRTAKISSHFPEVCRGGALLTLNIQCEDPHLQDKIVLNILIGLIFNFNVKDLNSWLEKQHPPRWSRLLVSSGSSVNPEGSSVNPEGSSDDNFYD
jgi:hypothetical protein